MVRGHQGLRGSSQSNILTRYLGSERSSYGFAPLRTPRLLQPLERLDAGANCNAWTGFAEPALLAAEEAKATRRSEPNLLQPCGRRRQDSVP